MAYIFLRIGTDPTAWVLESTDPDTVAARLSQATGPVVLPVLDPLQGNLVVSPSAAATISVARPSPLHGWHPSHIALPRWPVLYLPSPTGPTQDSPGYPLEPNTDLAALEQAHHRGHERRHCPQHPGRGYPGRSRSAERCHPGLRRAGPGPGLTSLEALFGWVFPVVQSGQAGQAVPVDLVFGGGGDDAPGDGAQGGRPAAMLQQGAFADDRAGA